MNKTETGFMLYFAMSYPLWVYFFHCLRRYEQFKGVDVKASILMRALLSSFVSSVYVWALRIALWGPE